MILVVGGIKGGSGKTTLTTNLTVLRAETGRKVLLVDSDEQKSTSIWSNQREALNIATSWPTIHLTGPAIHCQLLKMQEDYNDIIVDVGGRDSKSQRSALGVADIFLTPFKPRSLDIWTLGDIITLISDMRIPNPKLKAYSIINQADCRGSENKEVYNILNECDHLKCLDFTIGYRKSFGHAASQGLGITELKCIDKKAVEEIKELYNFIYTKKYIKCTLNKHGVYMSRISIPLKKKKNQTLDEKILREYVDKAISGKVDNPIYEKKYTHINLRISQDLLNQIDNIVEKKKDLLEQVGYYNLFRSACKKILFKDKGLINDTFISMSCDIRNRYIYA